MKNRERVCAVHFALSDWIGSDMVRISSTSIAASGMTSIVVMLAALAVAGCKSTSASKDAPSPGLSASMRSSASAVFAKVRVIDRGDGVSVMLSAQNMLQGNYRLSFHENGNCASPNSFSAGRAWAPPGRNPKDLIPPLYQVVDGGTEAEVHVAGVHTTGENGVAGRSILLWAGNTIEDLQPGVRNNVLACGVFEPARPVF
jgi:Cu/Zn superoxide dismutase